MVGDSWDSGITVPDDFKHSVSEFETLFESPAFKEFIAILMSRYDAMSADIVVEENLPDLYRLQGRMRELGTVLTLPETIVGVLKEESNAEVG